MAVDDHGLETIRKAGEEVTPGDKSDYYIKVAGTDASGAEPIAVSGSFSSTPGGGGISSGVTTEVTTVNDTTWIALPPTAATGRTGFTIQNQSGVQIKLNFATPAGYVGVIVENGGERFYDLNDSGVINAKAAPGSGTISGIIIEELVP